MRPLLALFVAFCLVSVVITKPLPEGDQEAANGTEEPKKEEEAQPTEKPADNANTGGDKKEEDGEKKTDDEDKSKDAGEENAEDEGNDATQNKEEGEGGEKEEGKGEGKNDPSETYNKVIELLDKTTKIDKVASSFLRAGLVGDLQTYLRNPIIDVIGRVGDYSKISSCFKSMGDDVKKILEEVMNSFKSCKDKKDSNEHQCAEDRSAGQDKIAKISSTISSCVASKKS